jgi:flagellar biosynthesis GTPase FlhF
MRIKTFTGKSLDELLPQIREELGPDAVVLGQRDKVVGGIGGFFGSKQVEVTAADRMPNDDALIEMDSHVADGTLVGAGVGSGAAATGSSDPAESALADRFRTAMSMGRQGGLDVTDTWDPAQDEELAHEYGRVLESATSVTAASAGFAEMDVPTVPRSGAPAGYVDPLEQARALADRTHGHVEASTRRIDASYGAAQPAAVGTYAPPAAMPLQNTRAPQSFQASVHDASIVHQTVPAGAPAMTQQQANEMLRSGLAPTAPRVEDPILAALDHLDLKTIAALRGAVDASKRKPSDWREEAGPELAASLSHLEAVGVDDDVAAFVATTVLRHRQPFAPHASVDALVHDVVEELIEVRTGFNMAGTRAHRMAVVGGSSSGKSSVVAKMAHTYASSGLQVGVVVVLPDDPTAAVVQDVRFISLGADVRYVSNVAQAQIAAGTFDQHDVVLIDTPGTTSSDSVSFEHVAACLQAFDVDDVHVVVPLSTSSRDAAHLVDGFGPLGANRLIVSRIDESRYIGQLLNLGFRLGLPMTFLSDGPHIPNDLRAASAREIATSILATADRTHES